MEGFPDNPGPLKASLVRALELKDLKTEANLLRSGRLNVSHEGSDEWGRGTEFYGLHLEVALDRVIQLEPQLPTLERSILGTAKTLFRGEDGTVISRVVIGPVPLVPNEDADTPVATQLPEFWEQGMFRLFVTHCSSQKAFAGELRLRLHTFGVSSFVAHDDIEPTLQWQTEIERALATMEALAALLSEDFPLSKWCDQEVGFALGRRRLVIPVKLHTVPYGFIERNQAISGSGRSADDVARAIVEALLRNDATSASMTEGIVGAVAQASSFESAKKAMTALERAPSLSRPQARVLTKALKNNSQLYDAYGVPERLDSLFAKHGHRVASRRRSRRSSVFSAD